MQLCQLACEPFKLCLIFIRSYGCRMSVLFGSKTSFKGSNFVVYIIGAPRTNLGCLCRTQLNHLWMKCKIFLRWSYAFLTFSLLNRLPSFSRLQNTQCHFLKISASTCIQSDWLPCVYHIHVVSETGNTESQNKNESILCQSTANIYILGWSWISKFSHLKSGIKSSGISKKFLVIIQ